MALITLSGYPSSGKTRRAQQIKDFLETRLQNKEYDGPKFKVVILSDDGLNLDRSAYDGPSTPLTYDCPETLTVTTQESRSEKPARGALFTAIQRQMALDTILIVDALNYIKGFRYQIYCAAREMKLRVCTVRFRPFMSGTFRMAC